MLMTPILSQHICLYNYDNLFDAVFTSFIENDKRVLKFCVFPKHFALYKYDAFSLVFAFTLVSYVTLLI